MYMYCTSLDVIVYITGGIVYRYIGISYITGGLMYGHVGILYTTGGIAYR